MTSFPLYLVEPFPEEQGPGMMWRYHRGDIEGRESWWIVLPNWKPVEPGLPSRISWRTTDKAAAPPHGMWDVSGTPPEITVRPSIDVECWRVASDGSSHRDGSHWHGFITAGLLIAA